MELLLSDIEKIAFKKRLLNECIILIQRRITTTKGSIANAQASANSEEKSSAGDKYDTSRAMSHLEKDMHSRQLSANQEELSDLISTDFTTLSKSATTGSFILCDGHNFFIAAGLGKIYFEGLSIYLISPHAPMAKILFQKKTGDSFIFNKSNLVIQTIF